MRQSLTQHFSTLPSNTVNRGESWTRLLYSSAKRNSSSSPEIQTSTLFVLTVSLEGILQLHAIRCLVVWWIPQQGWYRGAFSVGLEFALVSAKKQRNSRTLVRQNMAKFASCQCIWPVENLHVPKVWYVTQNLNSHSFNDFSSFVCCTFTCLLNPGLWHED